MRTERELARGEIRQVWSIDRREVIDNVYYYEKGTLVLRAEHFDLHGWSPDEAEKYTPILLDCFDRGGWFYGIFQDHALIALAILESKFIGKQKDQLQLKFLHVSQTFRDQGLGRHLFECAKDQARARGAKRMYISATPSEHTINFYLRLGCVVTAAPDPELFALEPDDIHLECAV